MSRTAHFLTAWVLAAGLALPGALSAQDTIKVGVLHSLSGTMAISETTLKDTILMMIDEQNKKGGLLGKKLEAVVVDPASDWPLFAEKARELLEKDKVAVVFGCWTSVSRKSVLPVFEKDNGLLFYPVQYEGEESSKNVIYTGAAPNQQAIPAVDYLMKEVSVKRWVLEGTDYVYPRTTNKILEAYLKRRESRPRTSRSTTRRSAMPTGRRASRPSRSSARPARRRPSCPRSTAMPTCRSTRSSATRRSRRKTFRSSPSRSARRSCRVSTPSRWSATWRRGTTSRASTRRPTRRSSTSGMPTSRIPKRTTNDPMEAHYIGFNLWVKAVQKAGTTDVDKVIAALPGLETPNLTGGMAKVLPNHHITKPVYIGEVQGRTASSMSSGRSAGTVPGDAWSDYLPGSKDIEADWVTLKCGNYNTKTKVCSGQNYK